MHLLSNLSRIKFFLLASCLAIICGAISLFYFGEKECLFAINSKYSDGMDLFMGTSSAYGRGDCIAVLLALLFIIPNLRKWKYFFSFCIYGGISGGITFLLKRIFDAPRPLMYFTNGTLHTIKWLNNAFEYSYPSGHTVGAFSIFTFLLLMFHLPKIAQYVFIILSVLCGISRIYLAQHFLSDVIAGAAIGILLGILSYWICNKFVFKK